MTQISGGRRHERIDGDINIDVMVIQSKVPKTVDRDDQKNRRIEKSGPLM